VSTVGSATKVVVGALVAFLAVLVLYQLAEQKVVDDVNDAPAITFTTTSIVTIPAFSFPPSTQSFVAN
jgi:hypothetical protein